VSQNVLNAPRLEPQRTAGAATTPTAYPRRAWRLPTGREFRAVAASFIFHIGLILVLGSITYVATQEFRATEIDSVFEEYEPPKEFVIIDPSQPPGEDGDAKNPGGLPKTGDWREEPPAPDLDEPEPDFESLPFEELARIPVLPPEQMPDRIDEGSREAMFVAGGVSGALDRLVAEIRQSLEEKKTLVIWLFDASGSLKKRREAIAERFENIYDQLRQLKEEDDPALKTVIAQFGETHKLLTPKPTSEIEAMMSAVRQIEMDESGKENVFAAVHDLALKYKNYRTRAGYNVMMVVVTDERGDDEQRLDEVVKYNRRFGMRTYVVGNASTFGRELGYVQWTYPDNSTRMFPVDQGPETARAERLRLPFWGGQRDRDLSSGHGPWGLTRLCAETGGLFLITEDNASGAKFDPAIMRSYQPDYLTMVEYDKRVAANKAKLSLVQAAALTRNEQDGAIDVPQTVFRADSDNVLRQQMTESQKPMAKLTYQLDRLLQVLEAGEVDRDKLGEPRWRAGYDLAMGRTLAMKVRSLGYNSVLAEMKGQPKKFSDPKNDQWLLVPSDQIISGATVKKLAKQARMYLERVINEHPDTPWALLAERELEKPLGWEWKEQHFGYQEMERRQAANNENKPPRDEKEEEKMRRRAELQRNGPKGL